MSKAAIVISLGFALALASCGDEPRRRTSAATTGSAAKPAPRARRPPAPKPKAKAELELSEADFVEAPTNRDPFRSYMSEFVRVVKARVPDQRPAKLDRYAIDELSLIAVVTGDVRAQAMFRDPTGTGVTVRRGDLISKSRGRVKAITHGRVVVEIKEHYEGGEKVADRVIEIHSKRKRR